MDKEKELLHYHRHFDISSEWSELRSAEGKVISVTPSCRHITGYSQEEFLGNGNLLLNLMYDADRQRIEQEGDLNHLFCRDDFSMEFRIITRENLTKWIQCLCRSVRDDNNQPVGFLNIFRDISEEKNINNQLQLSLEKFRIAFEQNPCFIGISKIDTSEYVEVNQRSFDKLGYSREEVIGKKAVDLFKSYASGRPMLIEKLLRDGFLDNYETKINRKDGSEVNVLVSATIITLDNEKYMFTTATDISELREKEKSFALLFEYMEDGFLMGEVITDKKGMPCDWRYLEVNKAHEHVTGMKNEGLRGRRILEIFPDIEPFWIETYGNVALSGESAKFENFNKNTGKYYEVSAFSPTKGKFAAIFRDITNRKLAERDMLQKMNELEVYRHKLRMLNQKIIELSERERMNIAEFLHEGLGQLLSVAFMQLSSLEHDQHLSYKHSKIIGDTAGLINAAILQCRIQTYLQAPPILKEFGLVKAIKWKLDEVKKNHPFVTTLKTWSENLMYNEQKELLLYRVISEFISNAVTHSKAGTISVTISRYGRKMKFTVSDDGIGFSYNPVADLRHEKGFGLVIIREQILAMSGEMTVDTSPGKGTTITVII